MAKLLANLIFEPKGKHDPTQAYTIKDTVMSADGSRVYFALQNVPVGVELTDTTYWKLQIDLSATKAEAEAATAAANAAAETANTAAANVKADVDRLSEEMAFNESLLFDVENVEKVLEKESEVNSLFISTDGKFYTYARTNLEIYSVSKGDKLRFYSSAYKLTGELGAAAFSTELPASNGVCTVIQTATASTAAYDFEYTVPEDGYISCCYVADYDLHLIVTSSVDTKTPKFPTEEEVMDILRPYLGDVESVIDAELTGSEYGGFINADGSAVMVVDSTYKITAYSVSKGCKAKLVGQGKLAASLPIISFSATQPQTGATSTVLESNAAALANYNFDYVAEADGYIWVASDTRHTNTIAVYAYKDVFELENRVSRLEKKRALKIQVFGDSITDDAWGDNRTWATILGQFFPATWDVEVVNSAVGGSGIGSGHSSSGRYAEKEKNYVYDLMTDGTLETDSDIVVMLCGTNNWRGSNQVGVWGDDTVGTTYGALKLIAEKVSTDTNAIFIICCPPQRYNAEDQSSETDADGTPLNSNGVTLRDFCDAYKKTAEYYGLPFIDLHASLGWNRMNVAHWTIDGLHPNNRGDELIAGLIAVEIMKHSDYRVI